MARTTTTPGLVTVRLFPFNAAGPLTTVKLTGNPELATATSANAGSPNIRFGNGPKAIVWFVLGSTVTVKVFVTALTPPLAVPPSSVTTTLMPAVPVALVAGV